MKLSRDGYKTLLSVCAFFIITIIIFIGSLPDVRFSKNEIKNVKTNIKRKLYTSNADYRDEYVDLWYDIIDNPSYDEIVVNRNTIYSCENTDDLIKYKINIEKMIDTCNKLIDIYGADFENVFYLNPWYKIIHNKEEFEAYLNEREYDSIESLKENFPDYDHIMKGEKFLPIFINTNTLNNFKIKCEENIKIIQKVLKNKEKEEKEEKERLRKEKQEKEEIEKIVYGKD